MARIDDSYSTGAVYGQIGVSEEDFKRIERDGRLKLSDNAKDQIKAALNFYRQAYAIERNAATVRTQSETLYQTLELLPMLRKFIDPLTEEHSHAGPMMRVIDRIYHLEDSYPDNFSQEMSESLVKSSISETELRKTLRRSKTEQPSHLVDVRILREQLAYLEFGVREAIREIQSENEQDIGGPNSNHSLNAFLVKLKRIYNKAEGRKLAFERFCASVAMLLPCGERPILPKAHNSIRRRVNRINK